LFFYAIKKRRGGTPRKGERSERSLPLRESDAVAHNGAKKNNIFMPVNNMYLSFFTLRQIGKKLRLNKMKEKGIFTAHLFAILNLGY
jgi:hypothetical protein